MTTATRTAEVEAAEAFLASPKTLDGTPPTWVDGTWGGEYTATWIILDSDGAPAAQLKFTAQKGDTSVSSINVIFQGRTVWRLDMDYEHVCHSNPHDAHLLKLAALVCGPHEHAWEINKAYLLSQDLWRLRYRRALPSAITRLGQGLLWLADEINLTIEPDQRGFDGPTRADLFDRSGL